jgi:hypothetical protein
MSSSRLPSPEALARANEIANRRLTPEEVAAGLAAPVTAEEREETLELVRWFRRRYPTGADRLAYVRRAYSRWLKNRPVR